ncbi:Diphthamide biosynthesis protein 2 [Lignoscripta atroalba]|nr:Diphthamide biosynthesis protein 2 [Lignoscripta atroalba]
MQSIPSAPPVLSTPDTHIFEDPTPTTTGLRRPRSDEEILITYEIQKTVADIRQGRWRRIALQFPDDMLQDAPSVYEALQSGLQRVRDVKSKPAPVLNGSPAPELQDLSLEDETLPEEKLYILADTSYGACCVDEIAAEHVDADVVVHYGRACLSPTARLPVIHVFTSQPLDLDLLIKAFKGTYKDCQEQVILMADVIYSSHLPSLSEALKQQGYLNIFPTSIVHDPSSPIPNRTVPEDVQGDPLLLKKWQLFHLSDPPQALLLTLSSRVSAIHIYPTTESTSAKETQLLPASTALALRRRYALLTSLSTASIFGILISTLSVKNYLHIVEHVKDQILASGKKSYTFVVGKVNAAKVANFSEVGGWVVIGCWESSLVESKDFWKPLITPFELELALKGDRERLWTGEWRSDFQGILDESSRKRNGLVNGNTGKEDSSRDERSGFDVDDLDPESESAPPEFDLRTGRYVSHSRPMLIKSPLTTNSSLEKSLAKRAKGDLAVVGGEPSPGADFLRSNRTWKGLGSDFEVAYDESGTEAGTNIEEGRSGIARGYTDGRAITKR